MKKILKRIAQKQISKYVIEQSFLLEDIMLYWHKGTLGYEITMLNVEVLNFKIAIFAELGGIKI